MLLGGNGNGSSHVHAQLCLGLAVLLETTFVALLKPASYRVGFDH